MVKYLSSALRSAAVTGICFLLTSTAYLAWTYRIMELSEAPIADAVTLIAAYLMQAAGIALFSLLLRRRSDIVQKSVYVALSLHRKLPAYMSCCGSASIPSSSFSSRNAEGSGSTPARIWPAEEVS